MFLESCYIYQRLLEQVHTEF